MLRVMSATPKDINRVITALEQRIAKLERLAQREAAPDAVQMPGRGSTTNPQSRQIEFDEETGELRIYSTAQSRWRTVTLS